MLPILFCIPPMKLKTAQQPDFITVRLLHRICFKQKSPSNEELFYQNID
jgi:hypothetical protein